MKKILYLVGIRVEAGLHSHIGNINFQNSECKIRLIFPFKREKGGIRTLIYLYAVDNQAALELARSYLEGFLDSLALVMKSSFYAEETFLVLKDEAGKEVRTVLRSIRKEGFEGLYMGESKKDQVETLWNVKKTSNQERSLRWLRLAFRSRSYHEQFIYYWLTLENLVGNKIVERPCKKCGQIYRYETVDKKEIKSVLQSVEPQINDCEFNKLWRLRQKVFHGIEIISSNFSEELRKTVDLLGLAVEKKVADTLNVKERIKVLKPVYYMRRDNIFWYLKFKTKTKKAKFVRDYPTDRQLKEFHEGSEVRSRFGFELLEFDSVYNSSW